MFFALFIISLCQSTENKNNKESKAMHTMREIKKLSNNISSIQFDTNDSGEYNDKNAISLVLGEAKIIKKQNKFMSVIDKALKKDDDYLKDECNNCIKIISQSALFTFYTIRKSTANMVNFYQSIDKKDKKKPLCSVHYIQLIFYNDDAITFTTEVYDLDKSLSSFHFNQNVTFEKVQINATSANPSLLCLGKFSLLNQ